MKKEKIKIILIILFIALNIPFFIQKTGNKDIQFPSLGYSVSFSNSIYNGAVYTGGNYISSTYTGTKTLFSAITLLQENDSVIIKNEEYKVASKKPDIYLICKRPFSTEYVGLKKGDGNKVVSINHWAMISIIYIPILIKTIINFRKK